ncbi:hypothetical protein HDU92_006020 [Lobulomyces angularis]|nr:hypothetical protein HDU92_006020 [Lobulomyces angularis]
MHPNFLIPAEVTNGADELILLILNLTTSAFVDKYQINNLNSVISLVSNKTDLEAPEFMADSNFNCFFMDLNSKFHKNGTLIPFHLRYHKPSFAGKYEEVKLNLPELYLIKKPTGKLSCNMNDFEVKKHFNQLESNFMKGEDNGLIFKVPIGVKGDVAWVSTLTIIFSTFGTFYLCYQLLSLPNF